MEARPLVKWVGGKGRLLPQLRPFFPPVYNRYFEPFCGGAAVFWAMRPERAWLNDANPHLINTYRVVRDDVEAFIADLSTRRYDRAEYEATRARFNAGEGDAVWRAATFIYINRCGFNGLWRVNGKGACNVPFGDYDNPTICDAENLRACSRALHGVDVGCGDFDAVEALAEHGDWIFCDSPYVPASKTANFTSYTADGFGASDQKRLVDMLRRLAARGVHWTSTNSDTPMVREFYSGFQIFETSRSGSISSKTSARQKVGEVVVVSGTWDIGVRASEVA